MRLAHLLLVVAVLAFVLALARDPMGRVFVIVFTTGVSELALGLTSIMALFQAVGAFGEAKSFSAHAEALAATTVVLAVGTAAMSGCLFAGAWFIATYV